MPNCYLIILLACYGIVSVPTGPWFCRKCESTERAARVVSYNRDEILVSINLLEMNFFAQFIISKHTYFMTDFYSDANCVRTKMEDLKEPTRTAGLMLCVLFIFQR